MSLEKSIFKANPKENIIIKNAHMHNLKNVDLVIPRNQLVVITGLSGSGKSSLAFDTLFAEGQRRYVESLSSYARQFLGKLDKPKVDYIKGISPAVAIEQKVTSKNSRSTVGTVTELYDYLKLLFSRVGKTISPVSGDIVKKDIAEDVLNFFFSCVEEKNKALLLAPLNNEGVFTKMATLHQQGFQRVFYKNEIHKIESFLNGSNQDNLEENVFLVVDRFAWKKEDESLHSRLLDSIQIAFYEGNGFCDVYLFDTDQIKSFSNLFEKDGITFHEPTLHFLSFNNPVGACKTCDGFGSVLGIDENLVIPNKSLSVLDDAIVCWKGESMQRWKDELVSSAHLFNLPIDKPIKDLTKKEYNLLWTGNKYFEGLNGFFSYIESKLYKIQYRVLLSRYRGRTICPDCKGTRLRKDAQYVKIDGKSIVDIVLLPINKVIAFFDKLALSAHDFEIAERILFEITSRLEFLDRVGLSYLSLNRGASTLSGGESQRINLATRLGSSLVGSMYILDEPSIGLHSKDTEKLNTVLRALQQKGNSVIVVEHDEDIMRIADYIIDVGPEAGSNGGSIVFEGTYHELISKGNTLTSDYLSGKRKIETPFTRREFTKSINVLGITEHNLQNIDIEIPLGVFSTITGVSGSGKSTFVKRILYPAVKNQLFKAGEDVGTFSSIEGDVSELKDVQFIDQNPIGKSSRSNPVTYVKAYDDIRAIFSSQHLAVVRGYKPGTFSFNVPGGRCEQCEGEGFIKVEMQFMADVFLPCDHCKGQKFKNEVLEVTFKNKSISEVLDLTIDDAISFFSTDQTLNAEKKLVAKLLPLQKVGLGYMKMGQSSNTLSGGEAQRVKLASFLGKSNKHEKTLFIFDEPTTGLHFNDIEKLLIAFNELVNLGHTLVVIEHNLDLVKCADWIIDMGPEGGDKGGEVVFAGTPEQLIKNKKSFTAKYLKCKLN